jgi:hypothetical protein
MLKKMMLLAGMALAAIAFAVPTSASAFEWNGTHEDSLTGFLGFGNPAPGQTKFGCEVHIDIDVAGETSTGELTGLVPTTATCVGEGSYSGCELVEDSATVAPATQIHIVETNKLTITTPMGEPVVVHYVYDAACPIEKTTLTVTQLAVTTTNSDLTDVTVTASGTMHAWIRGVGQITTSVALFGTLGTAADTITIS